MSRRWSAIPLIDVAKEALLRSGALSRIAEAVGANMPFETLAERLILAIYGYGTNAGINAVIPAGGAHTEGEVRYVRRRYLIPEVAAEIARIIANATFAMRDEQLWGTASVAVASDSTHFRT